MNQVSEAIQAAVLGGDQYAVATLVDEALAAGDHAGDILSDGLVPGMRQLGERFKDGQAFLPEILISCRAMSAGLELLRPHLAKGTETSKGTVVIGTVQGDLHDIGKKLVAMLLAGNGYEVIDLGVDVAPQAFVDAARAHGADIAALSALLTTTTPRFRDVIDAFAAAGGRVKVMVGGAPVSAALAAQVGADGFAPDCVTAVDEARRLIAEGCAG